MDWNMLRKIRVEASAWIFFSVLVLLLPLNWVLSALAAAAVHELCHVCMMKILSVPVHDMRIGARGAMLDAGHMTPKQEILCALAGPVGSFSLLLLIHVFPRIALCGLVQGLYNLLPFFPMDGGRVLKCAITILLGKRPCKPGKVRVQ